MMETRPFELPPDRRRALRRAVVLEWVSVAYLASVSAVMFLVMGSSQAMKTEWLENTLSLVPPIAFLVSARVRTWRPDAQFPYGYHRAVSIAFLVASLALFAVGVLLLIDAGVKLVRAERPSIGTVALFGAPVWLGWLMLPALAWSIVPAVFLGRAKMGPAHALHDKTLEADASMMKAQWLSSVAAGLGVLGIGIGWWWADAVMAALISLDILHDGFSHVRSVTLDLMDRAPRTVDGRQAEGLPARVVAEWKNLDWVDDAWVRLRENGHVFFGEAIIRPVDQRNLVARTYQALEVAYALDWRLQDLVVQLAQPGAEPVVGSDRADKEEEDAPGGAVPSETTP